MSAVKKPRVLHLVTGLNVGGAERMLLNVTPHLQSGMDNRVCCIIGRGEMGPKIEAAGVPVDYLDLRGVWDLGVIGRFGRVVRKFKPDILVTYLIHSDLFGRIFGRLYGIKVIVCSQRGSLLNWEFLRLADRLTKGLVTQYIVQTDHARDDLSKKLKLPTSKFTVIPNAIDVRSFSVSVDEAKLRKSLNLPASHLIISCVARLRQGKGHEYLLEGFEKVFSKHPDISLLLIGDGEREAELKEQIHAYQSKDNIHFVGNRKDVKELLHISDLFVLPTLAEGMSNAILEAMASRLPIIVTDIPENRVLITDHKSGYLVKPKSSQALADAITDFLEQPKLRSASAEAAFQTVTERYDIITVSRKLQQTLLDLCP